MGPDKVPPNNFNPAHKFENEHIAISDSIFSDMLSESNTFSSEKEFLAFIEKHHEKLNDRPRAELEDYELVRQAQNAITARHGAAELHDWVNAVSTEYIEKWYTPDGGLNYGR